MFDDNCRLQGPMVVSPALTLENLNHYLFAGKQRFQSGFRVQFFFITKIDKLCNLPKLVHSYLFDKTCCYILRKVLIAGGGIGDSTLFLAEQLNHTEAEVNGLITNLITAHISYRVFF